MHTPQEREQERYAIGCAAQVLLAIVLIIFAGGVWLGIMIANLLQ
jgi:hypothetical protein